MARPLPYVPYEQTEGCPHVMVDGSARAGSVLTLSHWPQSPTPAGLARDVSAEIVLAYLEAGKDLSGAAEAVTNDHFDEDGVMSIMALVDPPWALSRESLVVDAAMCGDFGVVRSDEAARVGFALAPLAEALAGPGSGTSERYTAVLPEVPDLVEHPERYESYWGPDYEALVIGRAALATGEVVIDELATLDLAVVERAGPIEAMFDADRLPGASGGMPIHAAAVYSATTSSRVLAFDGDRCELALRYEGWVRTVSRKVPLRPELEPLAALLTAEEPGEVVWEASPVGAIVARLRPSEERSDLSAGRITEIVAGYLESAPPAWDPFRKGGSYIPIGERATYRSSSSSQPRARGRSKSSRRPPPRRRRR